MSFKCQNCTLDILQSEAEMYRDECWICCRNTQGQKVNEVKLLAYQDFAKLYDYLGKELAIKITDKRLAAINKRNAK